MPDIYLIPTSVPCPNCGTRFQMSLINHLVLSKKDTVICNNCHDSFEIKKLIGPYVGVIKDVEL